MLLTNKKDRITRNRWSAADFRILQLAFCFLSISAIVVGCRSKLESRPAQVIDASTDSENSSESFESQIAAVRNQNSTTIRLTQSSLEASQLDLIRELSQLDVLVLDQGIVTDTSFKNLSGLRSLQHLRLRNSPLSDDAIAQLSLDDFPNLRILNLPQSSLSAVGLERLKSLPNLVQLRLGGSKIDDQGLEILSQFPKLQSLHLIGPKLSDRGLQHFANAPELASLYIDDCKLSDSAWELLFKAKPNLHVHIDQQHHDRDPNADSN